MKNMQNKEVESNTDESGLEKGNKLIAEFMGRDSHDKLCYKEFGAIDYSECKGFYHSSWEWIMPVVEKISKIADVTIKQTVSGIYASVYVNEAYYQSGLGKGIEQVWISVVGFIKWYNQNKIIYESRNALQVGKNK